MNSSDEGPLRVGDTFLGKYQILGVIGRGGHGRVYRAVNLFMGRQVALKVLDRPGGLTEEARHRGQLEAGLLGRLEHPNIVRVYDAGISGDGQLYIVMELLKGKTLGELLRDEGPLEIERGLRLIEEVCGALDAAHAENAVHRDLKPANIFVTEDGTAKVLDFGVAKIVGAPGWQTQQNMVVGTCLYMSPEQIQGQPATPRSDVYALGLLAFEAFHGTHPILLDEPQVDVRDRRMVSWLQVKKTPPRLDELIPGFPEYVGRLVHTAIVKRPGARFETAREMADKTRICISHYAKEKPIQASERKRFGLFGRRPVDEARELPVRREKLGREEVAEPSPRATESVEPKETRRLFPKTEEQVIEDVVLPAAAQLAGGAEVSATATWNEPVSDLGASGLGSSAESPARTQAFGSFPDGASKDTILDALSQQPSNAESASPEASVERPWPERGAKERRPSERRQLERSGPAVARAPSNGEKRPSKRASLGSEPMTPGEAQSLSLTIAGGADERWRLHPRLAMALTILTGCALGTSGAFLIHRTFFSKKVGDPSAIVIEPPSSSPSAGQVVIEPQPPLVNKAEPKPPEARSAQPSPRAPAASEASSNAAAPPSAPNLSSATNSAPKKIASPEKSVVPVKSTATQTSAGSSSKPTSSTLNASSKTSASAPSPRGASLPASGLPSSGLDEPATSSKATSRSATGK